LEAPQSKKMDEVWHLAVNSDILASVEVGYLYVNSINF